MKKAYIIMAHKNPLQVRRLISRLNDGFSEFFIHIDQTVAIAPFEIIKEISQVVQFVERADSKWGGFGFVQASLNGLKAVRDSNKYFDRVFLLSGQDYPIKSNDYINDFLEKHAKSVFIDYFPIPDYQKWDGKDRGGLYRVDKFYFGLKWYELLQSRSINLLSTYLPFLRRKIPNEMKPFAGSAWWSVDLYTLNYILDYHKTHPEYRAFHQSTFVPDELFLQMIVGNSKDEVLLKSLENDNHRLIIWGNAAAAHPNTLKANDFAAIQASEQLFARKFDEKTDAEILDLIDSKILLRN